MLPQGNQKAGKQRKVFDSMLKDCKTEWLSQHCNLLPQKGGCNMIKENKENVTHREAPDAGTLKHTYKSRLFEMIFGS